jgi:peptidyl-dipeptidase A
MPRTSLSRLLLIGALALAFVMGSLEINRMNAKTKGPARGIAPRRAVHSAASSKPTAEEARAFIDAAETRLLDLWIKSQRASWVQENFITDDTEQMAADADEAVKVATVQLAGEAKRFDGVQLPPDVARKLKLLKLSVDIPAPRDPQRAAELAKINASLQSDYGKGKWCPQSAADKCLELSDLEKIMDTSHDPRALREAWVGWHAIGAPMRHRYTRMTVLANDGARELGFADVGAMWRSNYDMPPEEFRAEVERLWEQVRPLYLSLHTYVRWQLAAQYGEELVPDNGPIPADLLGNMWAQDWSNIYPLVVPPNADPGYDLTKILEQRNTQPPDMVHDAERFFTSLGFAPLPPTFWDRSLFVKPRDRAVVCHASAWDIDYRDDLRVKVCLQPTAEDFAVIHHELGHNFYQRAYDMLPPLFMSGANDGFHEAIGDTIALSITPDYLKQIGFLQTVPPVSADIGLLMQRALAKVAFLPFGLMIDQWRWRVFSGEIKPADYNSAWWAMRLKYQGVAPPVARSEADFDPGAKYHVPANVPYMRYFLAVILQFQFHRALCQAAGYQGPLNRCSIYGNRAAGARLEKMLATGQSRPWPDALEAITGQRQMDATAMLEYFAPLKEWLDEQNKGHQAGW